MSENVNTMLGNPKKAIFIFSIPIAVALLVQMGNNIVDSLWVAGLGADAMAAVGISNPVLSVLIGVGTGLGIGASAAISRNIGMKNKDRADKLATQGLLLGLIVGLVLTPIAVLTAEPIYHILGAGDALQDCLDYSYPLFFSSVLIILSGMFPGILRGEGAVRQSMYILVIGAVANIILDPIFIYTLDWGVAGAAWATVVSFVLPILIGSYWYFIRKSTYLQIRKADMKYDKFLVKDIMSVGLPESLELSVMNLFNFVFTYYVISVGSVDLMGVYTVVWRVVFLLLIPAQAIGGAIITICSAEFGMRRYDMILDAYKYSTKLSLIITLGLMVFVMIIADPIASVFTFAEDLQYLHNEMVDMVRIFAIFLPAMALVYLGSSLLQAVNRATVALISTFLRNFTLAIVFVIVAHLINTTYSLWWSITIMEILGGLLMAYLAHEVIHDLYIRHRKMLGSDEVRE